MNRAVLIVAGVALLAVAFVAAQSLYTVQQAQQALVLQFGQPIRVVDSPGLNYKLPFVQNVVYFDKRVLDFDADRAEVPTLDQKQVDVDSFARYRIVDPLLFFQSARDEAGLRQQLRTLMNANLYQVFAKVPMAQVLSGERAQLMERITENVSSQAKAFGIDVIDVRVKRVDLPEENSQAIFRRMQTQREQEARKIRAEGARDAQAIRADADKRVRVIVADAQKKGQILRGEGEAEATRIYNAAYSKDPAFFDFFRSLQAMSRGLGGDTTRYVGPPDGEFFRFFGRMDGEPPAAATPPKTPAR
ncbi:MAG: protease modulator HflC [Rhodospirillales bacterium]